MERISKENYYLDIAETVLSGPPVSGGIGAIIVKNDEIISPRANGAPRAAGTAWTWASAPARGHAGTQGAAVRAVPQRPRRGQRIISASRRDMVGSTLYLVGRDARTGALLGDATSCAMCRRQVINAGISRVIRRTEAEFQVVGRDGLGPAGGMMCPLCKVGAKNRTSGLRRKYRLA